MRTALASLGALGVGMIFLLGIQRIVERQQTADEINRLRDELYRARLASDRCRSSLQTSEAALRQLGVAIDSLRREVDAFESMDGRGVPAESYDEYMEVFDSYNDSVAVWEGREERLRAAETSCRENIEEHNAISDSLQTVLEEAGIGTP